MNHPLILLHPASVSQPTRILKQYLRDFRETMIHRANYDFVLWCLACIFNDNERRKEELGVDDDGNYINEWSGREEHFEEIDQLTFAARDFSYCKQYIWNTFDCKQRIKHEDVMRELRQFSRSLIDYLEGLDLCKLFRDDAESGLRDRLDHFYFDTMLKIQAVESKYYNDDGTTML